MEGERIRLRAIEDEDLSLIVKWRNNPRYCSSFFEYEPLSLIDQRKWFYEKKDGLLLIIQEKLSDSKVGIVGLYNIDLRNRKAEFGRFFIDDNYLRKGYAEETLALVLNYGFNHLGLNKIYLDVFSGNEAATNLYKKIGFFVEATFVKHIYNSGGFKDVLRMSIFRSDYDSTF